MESLTDGAQASTIEVLAGAKSMGGHAIMFAGGALEWPAYRFHSITVDSTSVETMAASRCASRLVAYRRVVQFLGVPQDIPSPLFTDNDGVWYVARDAATATKMVYIIRHVRHLQGLESQGEIRVFQIDGRLNPADALTKWLETGLRMRHYAFLMGDPVRARALWEASPEFKHWVPKRLVPVPAPPIDTSEIERRLKESGRADQPQVATQEQAVRARAKAMGIESQRLGPKMQATMDALDRRERGETPLDQDATNLSDMMSKFAELLKEPPLLKSILKFKEKGSEPVQCKERKVTLGV